VKRAARAAAYFFSASELAIRFFQIISMVCTTGSGVPFGAQMPK
jgi:hypothetical protein